MHDEPDPLTGIDAIDWTTLTHASGSASDVPGLLHDIASGGPDERREAISSLWGNIHHQGTVYAASAPAVPFLARLARAQSVPPQDQVQLIWMIAAIASGASYLQVHESIIRGGLTDENGERRTEERKWVRQAHEAAVREAPALLIDLPNLVPAITWAKVGLAAQVPEAADDAVSGLRELKEATSDPLRQKVLDLTFALINDTVAGDDLRGVARVRPDLEALADPASWDSPAHGAKYFVMVLLEESDALV
jgi:hypothetical protein